ncbi:CRISPR-associated endonuclease Cas1 [Haliscomenobacter hydrossis]|uniref:CRISPR-associated endonuclease Cas1 n=1 Tax=Haliscomenobacter hydrossis (strain ATCC 27775 / DSM 1100 / LMG 10767 / O) TaxID=760192 RepID=F4L829_HALH1|nr:CRISPR-associated endonuclease Cas1 [Haliscomenobacter hydrossis]AEE54537.1 CRISPR-associated protein Cas1 [Haliscomenobacter hydrossis DSM 1100]
MEIFIQSENVYLDYHEGTILVVNGEKRTPVAFKQIERIWIHPSTSIAAQLLVKLLEVQIELVICSGEGSPLGTLSPWVNPIGARARRRQLLFANSPDAQRLAATWIVEKQVRQYQLLAMHLDQSGLLNFEKLKAIALNNQAQLELQLPELTFVPELQEAVFGRLFFGLLSDLLPVPFQFEKRSRQPALDYFNAGLNYGYGIFYGMLQGQVQRVGLDPYIGFFHKERDGNPVLVYDLIESFRPWVEQACLHLAKSAQWKAPEDFALQPEGGYWLGPTGKEKLIKAIFEILEEPGAQPKTSKQTEMFQRVKELQQLIHHLPID